jgi:hypothetical protein
MSLINYSKVVIISHNMNADTTLSYFLLQLLHHLSRQTLPQSPNLIPKALAVYVKYNNKHLWLGTVRPASSKYRV